MEESSTATAPKITKMTDTELDALYKTVADGITMLLEQSEANGDKDNRARILFYALSGYLEEQGILDSMSACAAWMTDQQSPGDLPSQADIRRFH